MPPFDLNLVEHWCYLEKIYINDAERRIGFNAVKVFESDLRQAYLELGYKLVDVPLLSIAERVNFILSFIQGG